MNTSLTKRFSNVSQAYNIIEDNKYAIVGLSYLVFFVGFVAACASADVLGIEELSNLFKLSAIYALVIGSVWWYFRITPKRRLICEKLTSLYPQLATFKNKIRAAEVIIEREREAIVSLIGSTVPECDCYSGLFLDGGRFEAYNGERPPSGSRSAKIEEAIKSFAKKYNLPLQTSLALGSSGVCVHTSLLGKNLYFG